MDLNELIVLKQTKTAELNRFIEVGEAEKRELNADETVNFTAIETEIRALETQISVKNNINTNPIIRKKENNMNEFSLLRAIEARANGRTLDENAQRFIDAGKDEFKRAGLGFSGDIVIPMEIRADILAGTAGAGQETVAEQKLQILAPLRAALVTVQAGANFLTGLIGDVSIPTYSGTSASWKGEVVSADSDGGTFTEITLTPKRLTASIDISKQFLIQDSAAAEAMLMNDIVNAIAGKLEATIFGKVAGSATQPAGLFVTAPSIAGVATWANIVALETAVDSSNALFGNMKYITNPAGRGLLKTTVKAAGQPVYLLDGNEMNGYPVLVSNHVASALQVGVNENGVIFGNFNDLVIAQWGGFDLIVDPFTKAKEGKVVLVINAYFDAKPRRAESFKTGSIK